MLSHSAIFIIMKITVSVPKEIEIDFENQRKITIQYLKSVLRWQDEDFVCLNTNVLMRKKIYHGSHSWSEDVAIRTANHQEIALQTILNFLNNKV